MNEYSEKFFCRDCNGDGTPPGWRAGCRWKHCPVHGVKLLSDADLDAIDRDMDADYMRDNPNYGIDMVQVAYDACGMRRVG